MNKKGQRNSREAAEQPRTYSCVGVRAYARCVLAYPQEQLTDSAHPSSQHGSRDHHQESFLPLPPARRCPPAEAYLRRCSQTIASSHLSFCAWGGECRGDFPLEAEPGRLEVGMSQRHATKSVSFQKEELGRRMCTKAFFHPSFPLFCE